MKWIDNHLKYPSSEYNKQIWLEAGSTTKFPVIYHSQIAGAAYAALLTSQ